MPREKRDEKNESTTQQTGEMPAVWWLNQQMPATWRKPIRIILASEDMPLSEFVAEAIREYAEKRGVTLPPRNVPSAWAS